MSSLLEITLIKMFPGGKKILGATVFLSQDAMGFPLVEFLCDRISIIRRKWGVSVGKKPPKIVQVPTNNGKGPLKS